MQDPLRSQVLQLLALAIHDVQKRYQGSGSIRAKAPDIAAALLRSHLAYFCIALINRQLI